MNIKRLWKDENYLTEKKATSFGTFFEKKEKKKLKPQSRQLLNYIQVQEFLCKGNSYGKVLFC